MFGIRDIISAKTDGSFKAKEFLLGGVNYEKKGPGDQLTLRFILPNEEKTIDVKFLNSSPNQALIDELNNEIGYRVTKFNLHDISGEAHLVLSYGEKDQSNYVSKKYKFLGLLDI